MDIKRDKPKKLLTPLRIALLLAIAAAGALYTLSSLDYSTRRIERDTVLIGTVKKGDMAITVAANGTLLAKNISLLTSQVEGTVKQIHVKAGNAVTRGTVLFELDNPQLVAAVETARVNLESAKADQISSQIDLENQLLNQESSLVQSQFSLEKAKLDLEAKQRLITNHIIPELEFKQAQLNVHQQEETLKLEQQRLQKSRNNQQSRLSILQSSVQLKQQSLAHAEADLANLQVRAEIDGVVQALNVDIGQRLRAGELLGRIAQPEILYAQLAVPSLQAGELALAQRVELNTHNGLIEGALTRIDPAVVNGTVLVDVEIRSALPASARPELAVEGTIYLAEIHNSLFVERPTTGRNNSEQTVFRLDASKDYAARTTVTLGRFSVNHAEVVAGLNEGDQIIISDSADFKELASIKLTN